MRFGANSVGFNMKKLKRKVKVDILGRREVSLGVKATVQRLTGNKVSSAPHPESTGATSGLNKHRRAFQGLNSEKLLRPHLRDLGGKRPFVKRHSIHTSLK